MATAQLVPSPPPTRRAQLLVTAGLVGATLFGMLPAQADPARSLAQVQARIDALNAQADMAIEAYAQAKLDLSKATALAALADVRVSRAQADLLGARAHMSSFVAAAYRTGGTDEVISLVGSSSPQTFLDRVSSLDRLAVGQADRLATVATARHRVADLQAQAARALLEARTIAQRMAAQQGAITSVLAQQKAILNGLQSDQRRQLLAAQEAARSAADAAAAAARAARWRDLGAYTGPASGRAGIAVAEAYNKLGDNYVWAAAGPDTFDCSGLTMWVWAKAGVALSHSAAAQYGEGRHVSQADIQPGDLTFYGSPIHHVGIYIGGGRMISAPHTGDVVKIEDAFRSDFVGAARP